MGAKLAGNIPESQRVIRIPPNDFGLTLLGIDMNRFQFMPVAVLIIGVNPESGEEDSLLVRLVSGNDCQE